MKTLINFIKRLKIILPLCKREIRGLEVAIKTNNKYLTTCLNHLKSHIYSQYKILSCISGIDYFNVDCTEQYNKFSVFFERIIHSVFNINNDQDDPFELPFDLLSQFRANSERYNNYNNLKIIFSSTCENSMVSYTTRLENFFERDIVFDEKTGSGVCYELIKHEEHKFYYFICLVVGAKNIKKTLRFIRTKKRPKIVKIREIKFS